MKKFIKSFIKKSPSIKQFINWHNPELDNLLKQIIEPDSIKIVVDVGSNKGQTIDWVLRSFKSTSRIFGFEPTKDLFIELIQKYEKKTNVKLINKALGKETGTVDFYTSNFTATNSCLEPDVAVYEFCNSNIINDLKQTKKVSVEQIRFDNWYSNTIKGEIIDILKIDTQGFDHNVILGVGEILSKIKIILTEIQFLPFYKEWTSIHLFEFLYSNNFYLFSFYENNRSKENLQLIETNAIFINMNYFPYKVTNDSNL
jgi:FkbM family methyltransferase